MELIIQNIKKLVQVEDEPREKVRKKIHLIVSHVTCYKGRLTGFVHTNHCVFPMQRYHSEGRWVFPLFAFATTWICGAGDRVLDKIRGLRTRKAKAVLNANCSHT